MLVLIERTTGSIVVRRRRARAQERKATFRSRGKGSAAARSQQQPLNRQDMRQHDGQKQLTNWVAMTHWAAMPRPDRNVHNWKPANEGEQAFTAQ